MKNIVEVKHLNFHYDEQTHAVKDVSFNVPKGCYMTIIGHNGSGKSTIAKLLIGLLEKESGDVVIDGMELNHKNLTNIRNKVGIVFQNPDNQFIGSTVKDDIAFGLENHRVDPLCMDDIIIEYASRVNMLNYLEHEPTKLSGGQKQRVAIAGVLAMRPDILIFDESTSMLDPSGKAEINKVIMELHQAHDLTIISITHDVEEVAKSDYVLVMDSGALVMSGTPKEIFQNDTELIKLQLDIPFSMKLALALNELGISIENTMDLEGLVDELCELTSKK